MRPWMLRHALNLYPPYLGAGVSVTHLADDYTSVTVELRLRRYNQNYVGTHFGGNLFAMTDPFYMLMLINQLGPAYNVWDQKSEITFVKPGRGTVRAHMEVTPARVEAIRVATAGGVKHFATFEVDIVDADRAVVATVHKTVYVREKPPRD